MKYRVTNYCPQCSEAVKVMYGKVSQERYDTLNDRLQYMCLEESIKTSLRGGRLDVLYTAECSCCGYKIEFKRNMNLNGSSGLSKTDGTL